MYDGTSAEVGHLFTGDLHHVPSCRRRLGLSFLEAARRRILSLIM